MQRAFLIADLVYGDAGKGSIVDYLTRNFHAHSIIRYNGGPQAAHNVIAPDGKHHTFAQFGSGMLTPDTRTYLSRYMLVDPLAMRAEERHLQYLGVTDAFDRTAIDRDALIITPYQQAANRLRELARGSARHGSCGMGIGETMADHIAYGNAVVTAADLADSDRLHHKLTFLRMTKQQQVRDIISDLRGLDAAAAHIRVFEDDDLISACLDVYADFSEQVSITDDAYLAKILSQPGVVIFEGAQGVLLDEWCGFHPYTTWSTTTLKNADTLLQEHAYQGRITRLGVLRSYMTRHGAGPFVTEDDALRKRLPEKHNANNAWQQAFRVGHLDMVALRYALDVVGPLDGLALTHLDYLPRLKQWQWCVAYRYKGAASDDLSTYFGTENDGWLVRIRKHDGHDLAYQAALTQKLLQCEAYYAPLALPKAPDIAAEATIERLKAMLRVPVLLASFGATAWAKQQVVQL